MRGLPLEVCGISGYGLVPLVIYEKEPVSEISEGIATKSRTAA
jgi:hypothetical protein